MLNFGSISRSASMKYYYHYVGKSPKKITPLPLPKISLSVIEIHPMPSMTLIKIHNHLPPIAISLIERSIMRKFSQGIRKSHPKFMNIAALKETLIS